MATPPRSSKDKAVMQMRCVACKREQYMLAVWDISHGEHPCVWCGHVPKVYTSEEEYFRDLERGAKVIPIEEQTARIKRAKAQHDYYMANREKLREYKRKWYESRKK